VTSCLRTNDGINSTDAATALRASGVDLIVLGVTSGVNLVELQALAADPTKVFTADNFDALGTTLAESVAKSACPARTMTLVVPLSFRPYSCAVLQLHPLPHRRCHRVKKQSHSKTSMCCARRARASTRSG
jgi:von Willebrand factor type A domain